MNAEITAVDDWKGHGHALRKPCSGCPFSRTVGTDLESRGNPDPLRYIGQAYGPFALPCHVDAGFDENGKCKVDPTIAQCGGAAIFRANVGVSDLMPPALLRLPPDRASVFATAAELIAHHWQIPLSAAEKIVEQAPPVALVKQEMQMATKTATAKVWATPKE